MDHLVSIANDITAQISNYSICMVFSLCSLPLKYLPEVREWIWIAQSPVVLFPPCTHWTLKSTVNLDFDS